MRSVKNKKLIIFFILLGIFIAGQTVFAGELAADWPPSPFGTKLDRESELPTFIGYLYEWGISIGGFLVFIALIIAGFQYLSSAGNPAMMKEAKDRVISALLGLALLLGSWLILNTINPQLTVLQLPPFEPGTPPKIDTSTIVEDVQEMSDITKTQKACTSAEISREGKATLTFDKPGKCKDFAVNADIKTDEPFTVQGYVKGDATSCMGFLTLFATEGCDSDVTSYPLNISGWVNVRVSTNAQSGALDVPKMPSFWDLILPWRRK